MHDRRKECTNKYFEFFFKYVKFTSLFYTLINFTKKYVQKNAFSLVGTKIWHEMPNSLKKISKKTLRKKLNGALLNILKT